MFLRIFHEILEMNLEFLLMIALPLSHRHLRFSIKKNPIFPILYCNWLYKMPRFQKYINLPAKYTIPICFLKYWITSERICCCIDTFTNHELWRKEKEIIFSLSSELDYLRAFSVETNLLLLQSLLTFLFLFFYLLFCWVMKFALVCSCP